MKTRLALILAALLVIGMANPALADEDDDRDGGKVRLLTSESATVTAGDTAWLGVNWTAKDGPVSDFSMVLHQEPKYDVQVAYPTNTGSFTGLMNGHELDEGEIDFSAIQVTVPADFSKKHVDLEFDVTYTDGGGDEHDKKFKIKVPVVQYTAGEHLVQHESVAELVPGSSAWVDVDFTGLAPVVDGLTMAVSGDLSIVYPSYGTSTSLHGDDRLDDGETDTARFRVDVGDAAPGSYEIATEITYAVAGEAFTRPGVVKVVVAG